MAQNRLSGSDRRSSIIEAATTVFAERGFNGAKTFQIASAAKVSEALVYRHFPSKTALYRAVLRNLILQQNASFQQASKLQPSTAGLINLLIGHYSQCLMGLNAPFGQAIRILFASLAGDGTYARLTYRRSLKLSLPDLKRAIEAARAAGDLVGPVIQPENASVFIDHIGSMILISRLPEKPSIPYSGGDNQILIDAVWFAGRGLGLTEEALHKHCPHDKPLIQAVELVAIAGKRRPTRPVIPVTRSKIIRKRTAQRG